MSSVAIPVFSSVNYASSKSITRRVESIDILRGVVMIIMALDHVRDYFHYDAFLYSPTDLSRTSVLLFLTRFITHYCAPVFVFLAGISAYLSGRKKSKRELTLYLFTRGLWLVFAELFIIALGRTFNPSFPIFNLQVIWAIGISMIVLSALIYMNRLLILFTAILLIAAHNLLDSIHIPGKTMLSFSWALLHDPGQFIAGHFTIFVTYPVIPWIGIMALGYVFGNLYSPSFDPAKRRKLLLIAGLGAILLFLMLRCFNLYGDANLWHHQKNMLFSMLSFLDVTKYPPSLLYVLVTLGPALIFLAITEKPLSRFTAKIAVFGRVPFFYYVLHVYLIHFFALIGIMISGYNWSDMILTTKVNSQPGLKGYGFNLLVVYLVWAGLIVALYPCCKWFDRYKRAYQSTRTWLTYI